jgi:hypothetical protein
MLVKKLTVDDAAWEKTMHAILADLRLDVTKCQELLNSDLNVDNFVRGILKSNLKLVASSRQEPSSPSSNGTHDITKVCNSSNSQQSSHSFVATLTQPIAEVQKTKAVSANCSSFSSSNLQPCSATEKTPKSELPLSPQRHDSLERSDINTHTCGEAQTAFCKRKNSKSSRLPNPSEVSQHLGRSEAQNLGNTAQKAPYSGILPTEAHSVSSDGPPPKESLLKRFCDHLKGSL